MPPVRRTSTRTAIPVTLPPANRNVDPNALGGSQGQPGGSATETLTDPLNGRGAQRHGVRGGAVDESVRA
ncbi:hypothetical protein GCM10007977_055000 [Dactylosporangium sucinum]|uniref:Uncharacterized protein n=1 Tax=Dactylosporangium sucinum TaxID=1424081 RepID=A0A917TZF7_9ACTN|nr:hypothetical protein GCM10007977_055000 [Dactylosporangium sucinum]